MVEVSLAFESPDYYWSDLNSMTGRTSQEIYGEEPQIRNRLECGGMEIGIRNNIRMFELDLPSEVNGILSSPIHAEQCADTYFAVQTTAEWEGRRSHSPMNAYGQQPSNIHFGNFDCNHNFANPVTTGLNDFIDAPPLRLSQIGYFSPFVAQPVYE
jgi:hypothetical protein